MGDKVIVAGFETVECPVCEGKTDGWGGADRRTSYTKYGSDGEVWPGVAPPYIMARRDAEHVVPCDYCRGRGTIDRPVEVTEWGTQSLFPFVEELK